MEHLQRGNKLWESHRMFLPEHKEALHERKREVKKIAKPILDEDALEQLQIKLMETLHQKIERKFSYYEDGKILTVCGFVTKIHSIERWVKISNRKDSIKIDLENMVDIH